MAESRAVVDRIVDRDEPVYGVSTGFGKLSDVRIPHDQLEQLQINLVRSHSSGIGNPLSIAECRAMMLLRANVLAMGFSGCRPGVVQLLIEMLNAGLAPVIPESGSVGASGDLAPLAHLALAAIGEGEIWQNGERVPSGRVLEKAGLQPLRLKAKEGLALLNGTQAMAATGGLALCDALNLAVVADVAGAMTLEALRGTPVAFDARIHQRETPCGAVGVRHASQRSSGGQRDKALPSGERSTSPGRL